MAGRALVGPVRARYNRVDRTRPDREYLGRTGQGKV